jgi:hypothetical protein
MALTLDELQKLIEIDSKIEKLSSISSDGKNLLIRIPKEIVDFLRLEKGDSFRWMVNTNEIKMEALNNANKKKRGA